MAIALKQFQTENKSTNNQKCAQQQQEYKRCKDNCKHLLQRKRQSAAQAADQ